MTNGNSTESAAFLSGWGRDLRVASILLTRVPLHHDGAIASDDLSRSFRVYPVIGALIGIAAAVVFAVASTLGLGPWLAALAALATSLLLTGALHEDGLADVVDGFGGGNDAAAKLDIMRDSRLGAYGTLALIFSVGIRAAALAALADPMAAGAALVASHSLARGAIPASMAGHVAVRRDGLGASAGTPSRSVVLTALGMAAVITIAALGPWAGLLAVALGGVSACAVGSLARRQIGGYTGDVLGALEQSVEIAVLIAAVAAA